MRRGFLIAPRPAPLHPSVVAFNRGEIALGARRFSVARRYFRLALRLDPAYNTQASTWTEPTTRAGDYLTTVDCHAARHIQAVVRGLLSRRRDIYRRLSIHVGPGDRFVRSPLNLSRYIGWLASEHRAGGARRRRARQVYQALHITNHDPTSDPGLPVGSAFGPIPAVWCTRRPCPRCTGEGGFDAYGPIRSRSRGGYHFRHLGPWTSADVLVPPYQRYQ